MQETIDKVEQYCQTVGITLTCKRKQVLTVLVASDTALSVYQIIEICKTDFGAALKAMSVYRILDFLQSQGLVHKIASTNSYIACADHAGCKANKRSIFLICKLCKAFKEVILPDPALNSLQQIVTQQDFQVNEAQIELTSVCASCQT